MHVFSFLCYNSQWGGWPAIDGCCIHWRAQSKIWLMKPKSNGEIIHSDKSILVFIFHFDGISLTTDFFIFKWQSSKTYFFSDCTGKVSNHERALHATGRDKYIQQLWQMHWSIWTNTESMDWKSVDCISMDFVAVYIRMDWESADSRECIAPTTIQPTNFVTFIFFGINMTFIHYHHGSHQSLPSISKSPDIVIYIWIFCMIYFFSGAQGWWGQAGADMSRFQIFMIFQIWFFLRFTPVCHFIFQVGNIQVWLQVPNVQLFKKFNVKSFLFNS